MILKKMILIKYSPGISNDSITLIEQTNDLERRYTCTTGWVIYNVPDTNALIALAVRLLTQIDSSQLAFDHPLTYFTSTPDDPEYPNQWYLDDIKVPDAWGITTGNSEIKVGVLDMGVDWNNLDFFPDNLLGWNFVDNNNNTYPSSTSCWHGNMVSSIIAARTNNNLGTCGIAGGWNSSPAKIVMCKITNSFNDSISFALCAIALDWALERGVKIFNFSWGANGACAGFLYPALKAEIEEAYYKYGATMFASAGNNNLEVAWPACSYEVISVGGTDLESNKWIGIISSQGSNYGVNTDISAPCLDIIYPNVAVGGYNMTWKTSCSAPMAVGVAVLMQSVNPCLSNVDIQYILQATADKTGIGEEGPYNYNWDPTRPGHSLELGYGKINAAEAVRMAATYVDEIAEYQNVVFDKPYWFTHDLALLYGSTLTITSTIKFNEGCKIIVEPGARLIINGGTLTSTCPGFWGGIEVMGNPDLPQYPISNQGYVHIFNNGKIEKANPGIYSTNGGIVVASDASFINNKRSVIMENYPGWNHSTFTRCKFELTNHEGLSGNQYFIGAELVHPLRISGCTFENKISVDSMLYPYRGYGILSLDADIHVYPAPALPSDPTHDSIQPLFKNLAWGVYAMHSGIKSSLYISKALFEENMRGAYLSGYTGSSYAMVVNSEFIVQNSVYTAGKRTYGMYLDHCSGYTVENNDFYSAVSRPEGYGLIINESGTNDNEIYNNSFHNLQYATQAQGCNRYSYPYDGGLCYRCNDFSANENDIFVISDAVPGTRDQGVSLSQGNKTMPAKNTFTEGNDSGFDVYNSFDVIQYFLDEDGNNYNVTPFPSVGLFPNVVIPSTYNKVLDCPYNSGSIIDINEIRGELAEATIKADSVCDILSVLMDGGSTEGLVAEVQTSIPPDALETRDELINQSPFLSDSVMLTAILKEDVLPNAMIRDILVENPQSAKSDALIEAIDNRFVSMPDSMMAQIMEGENFLGAKEEKEQELIKWNSQYAVALKNLLGLYDRDTTGVYGVDSLISIINSDASLNSRYDLVSLYYRKNAIETGNFILNTIPSDVTLSENQQMIHDMYVSLFPMLDQVASDTNGTGSLDSTQIETLSIIATNNDAMPGVYAKNLLIKKGLLQYDEPILIGSSLKQSKKWKPFTDNPPQGSNIETMLQVYPNPAGNYFIIEYRVAGQVVQETEISISVTDMLGRDMLKFVPKHRFDQIVVPTESLTCGSFLISLKINGQQKGHVTVIVKK